MDQIVRVVMPQLNPNEDKAYLSSWLFGSGAQVRTGDVLASLETTKSVEDLLSPADGHFFSLVEGDAKYRVGSLLGIVSPTPDVDLAEFSDQRAVTEVGNAQLTNKAREFALRQGVDLSLLPKGVLLKKEDVQRWLASRSEAVSPSSDILARAVEQCRARDNAIVVIGAGTTAKLVIGTIRALGAHSIVGILDGGYQGEEWDISGVPVIGRDDEETLRRLFAAGVRNACNAVLSFYDLSIREDVFAKLRRTGYALPPIVHPNACIEDGVTLGDGVFVHAQAYIGADCVIGDNVFVNTRALVSHDCTIGSTVFLAPNSVLGGLVSVGRRSVIGMCATVLSEVRIGDNVLVTNGADISADIEDGVTVR